MSIYMQIQGIDGNVSAKGHQNWIELESAGFNTKRNLSTQPGNISNREGSRPIVSEVTITKRMDKTSPLLFNESVVGTAKPQVLIDLTTTGDSLTPYMQYTLSNVIVSGYTVNTDPATVDANGNVVKKDYPTESVTLNFDKIEMKFTPFDQNHKPQSPIPSGYDLSQATAV